MTQTIDTKKEESKKSLCDDVIKELTLALILGGSGQTQVVIPVSLRYQIINLLERAKKMEEALELLADEDRNDGTGSTITNEDDRLGYPIIEKSWTIAQEALKQWRGE